jgi:hypothetical protein
MSNQIEVDGFSPCCHCQCFNEAETRMLVSCEAYPDGIPQLIVICAVVCKDFIERKEKKTTTAKAKNIIEMAFMFSTMGRVFEKGSQSKIFQKFEALMEEVNAYNVLSLHEEFIKWFQDTIKTVRGKQSSYGQAAKVTDIMLKVCMSYCHLPSPEEADRIIPKLPGAIDNLVLEHFGHRPGLGNLTRELYLKVQDSLKEEAAGMSLCDYDDILWSRLVDEKKGFGSIAE